MTSVGEKERATQETVIEWFTDTLGYRYLGFWKERPNNRNIEESYLSAWLESRGYDAAIITKVIRKVTDAATLGGTKTLYDANRAVYDLLRYGVKIQPSLGEPYQTVWLVDWETPAANDFGIAEEVTVAGVHGKRPDLVLYLNGIAVGVIELKRSTVSVSEGIRQNLDSQRKEFIRPFYTTVQLVMAGNATEGLRYGVIETPEKYYLEWKEDNNSIPSPLLRGLSQVCSKPRLLELIHDFMVFDSGTKKTCRHNQYFGVNAAQTHIQRREGGIIWHTQGSGKSLTMVWLAKWIREHVPQSRVLLITDRTELDEQIEGVFLGVQETIHRTSSGADLVQVLGRDEEWLICSLIHKFGRSDEGDIDGFLEEIRRHLPAQFQPRGDIVVFVDECHRTQSGKLHHAMKALLPNAMLIGFTGTPLLKRDKQTSIEVFGPYIHTYKYNEAVRDGVVLDLRYEARDIDQRLTAPAKIDQWFASKTSGLTDVAKAQIKRRWGTLQQVLSSRERLQMIVADILMDMETRDRLKSGHGNALLVSSSIYSACRLYEFFQATDLAGKCAIITSYKPSPADMKGEESGEGLTEKLRQYAIYCTMLAKHFDEPAETAMYKTAQFEREVKHRFIHQPGQMKLLIVVDKLLTGFDAPPATYLYIDKQMRDHGLFQAICRVNRLDGNDKAYGYIIDYKDLFQSLEHSIREYTGAALDGYDAADVAGLLKDRIQMERERLNEAREAVMALCEPVLAPRDTPAYLAYFCGSSDQPAQLNEREPRRVLLYKLVATLVRSYANLANDMAAAGYSAAETQAIKADVTKYEAIRSEVKIGSGDAVDLKRFEPAMRHLIDTYIRADASEKVSAFEDIPLVQLIVERGEQAIDALPPGIATNQQAVAETIEQNVRRVILDEMAINPRYYERMSDLLDALIQARKQQALDYQAYLAKMVALTRTVMQPETQTTYPPTITSGALRALYDTLEGQLGVAQTDGGEGQDAATIAALAVRLDTTIRQVKKAQWRDNPFKLREVQQAIRTVLHPDVALAAMIMEIVKQQHDY
ncbi:type I restriction endonuclease subunit R [Herpetosiphon geysericola]|uniref:Type I restriction enzyme endonuclease subunit n=1 Tax=Herpetosiphon geysericola TaxID=70996 RepID=A0A0P6XXH4_9CHLR|nr:HsdR family type I site-specific deoxyribonuclease [Herpetosiphon geysericola]KPL80622.1 restriction endonuclease subunit R [Herpetosiphon geysericola]